MSDYAKIENTGDTRQNLAARLGFIENSALDAVDRSKYSSDSEYLAAAAQVQLEREKPEFQRALSRVTQEYEKRRAEQEQARANQQYEELRKNVALDSFETREVEKAARARAEADLASGKISTSGLGAAIMKYSDALTAEARDKKAGNAAFNALIRSKWRG